MYHLKLIKGRSYTGIVEASVLSPDVYVEKKQDADYLVMTGYFKRVEDVESDPETTVNDDIKTLDKMNVSELETFATYKGISLKGIKKRDDIIKKLRETLPADELEGEIVYGSPTMVELQGN